MRRHDRAQEAAVGHELALDGLALEPGPGGRDADGAVHRGGDAEGEGRQRAQEVKVKGVEDLHVLAPGDLVRPAAELESGHVRRPGAGELGQGEDAEVLPPELAVRLETRVRGTQKQTFGGGEVIELGRKSSIRQTWIQKGENVVVDGWVKRKSFTHVEFMVPRTVRNVPLRTREVNLALSQSAGERQKEER